MKKWIIFLIFPFVCFSQTPREKFDQSVIFFEQQNHEKALASINNAIEESKYAVEDFFLLKYQILLKKKDFGLVREILDEALIYFPDSVILLWERVEYCILTNDFKQSKLDLIRLMNLEEKYRSIDYFLKLASLEFKTKNIDESLKIVKQVLKGDSTNYHAINMLASILTEKKQYDKALELFQSILDKDVENFSINIGYVYQKLMNHNKAIEYFKKSLSINRKNPIALSNLAKSKLVMGEINKALELINQSIEILPSNSYAYKLRGEIYLALSNNEKACFDLIVAKELGYENQYQDVIFDILPEECKTLFFNKMKK